MRYFANSPLPSPLLSMPVLLFRKKGTGGRGQPLYEKPVKVFCRLCENKVGRPGGSSTAGCAYFSGGAGVGAGDIIALPDGRRLEVFSVRVYRTREGCAHHLRAVLTLCR